MESQGHIAEHRIRFGPAGSNPTELGNEKAAQAEPRLIRQPKDLSELIPAGEGVCGLRVGNNFTGPRESFRRGLLRACRDGQKQTQQEAAGKTYA